MKKILFALAILVILPLVFFVNSKYVFADLGPPKPDCAQINQNTGQPGCGFIYLSGILDVSNYTDRFVFLVTHDYYDAPPGAENAVSYDLQTKNQLNLQDYFRVAPSYLAIDEQYFKASGGISGLFNTTKLPNQEDPNAVDNMTPKDPAAFAKNSYTLVVSTDDKYLGEQTSNLIGGKYTDNLAISGYMPPLTTPNLNCNQNTACTVTVTYTPQAILGNYIVIAPFKTEFNPPNADQPAPYKRSNGSSTQVGNTQSQVQANQNSQNIVVPPNPSPAPTAPMVEEHISWWSRMWSAIGNFFKQLFK